jgi:hypothetical protein
MRRQYSHVSKEFVMNHVLLVQKTIMCRVARMHSAVIMFYLLIRLFRFPWMHRDRVINRFYFFRFHWKQ